MKKSNALLKRWLIIACFTLGTLGQSQYGTDPGLMMNNASGANDLLKKVNYDYQYLMIMFFTCEKVFYRGGFLMYFLFQ